MIYRIILPCFLAFAAMTSTATAADLPLSLDKIISAAAARDQASGNYQYLDVALELIGESHPELAEAAQRRAQLLAPEFIPQIAQIAQKIDPSSSGQPIPALVAKEEPAPAEENTPPAKPEGFISLTGWSGDVQLGLNLRSGSNSDDNITLGIDVENERRNWTHKVRANYELLKKEDTPTDDDLLVSYQLDRKVSERLYVFGLLEYRNEFASGYQMRFLQTVGLGYKILTGDRFKLNAEVGPSHRTSKLNSGDATIQEWGGRISFDADWKALSWLDINLKGASTFTSGVISYEALLGLTSPLTERLSARISVEYDHDASGPASVAKDDLKTNATLLYGF
jgi:putative salt-induced outer membrane protein